MDRSDYAFRDLSQRQYQTIISLGTMQGASPLLPRANYDALIRESRAADVDPRLALAWLLWEDHFGTDPNGGIELAKVFNFAGIKWAGQPDAFDSGIQVPPDEQPGTYAGFPDVGAFIHELYRTLTNEYCGPYFDAGDLANAASVYITGRPDSGHGQERVDSFLEYRRDYPPEGASPVTEGVYGEDLIAKFETQIGHRTSGDYDPRNGDHAWAYYCEAGAESTGRNCGLDVTARTSALDKYNACLSQGLIQQGAPEHGAQVFFGLAFYSPDGHTGLWNAERGQLLGTLTDGTGVGYRNWGPGTVGYLGWCRMPGVVGPHRGAVVPVPPQEPSHPPMGANWVPENNPTPGAYDDPDHRFGFGGGNLALVRAAGDHWAQTWGFPTENEHPVKVTDADGTASERIGQRCERNWILHDPNGHPTEWQSVGRLLSQTVEPL